jgi:FkbM family methyltransferase
MNSLLHAFRNKVREKGLLRALYYSACFLWEIPYRKLWLEPVRQSYSQAREDLLIERAIGANRKGFKGFYIDIGAYDPQRLSNTKHFYQKGWTGINVEPNKLCHAKFVRDRPRDLNLNVGVGLEPGKLTFYVLNEATLSTFSEENAVNSEKLGYRIVAREPVEVITLTDLFQKYVADRTVDFVVIDAEGLDVSVLEGNDWNRWRPKAICIEVGDISERAAIPARIKQIEEFMNRIRYRQFTTVMLYGTPLNMIFVREELPLPAG